MFSIGQVLFVVLAKKNQVYPMRVVEVITKKTLAGEEVKYSLQAGSDPNQLILLDQIDGEVFESVEVVRETLIKRATSQMNRLVDAASTKASEWYGVHRDVSEMSTMTTVSEVVEITLPDGTRAKAKIPPEIALQHDD